MPQPQILTHRHLVTWLPSDVTNREDLSLLVWRAEQKVLNRYREHETPAADAVREDTHEAWVQLIDWEETDDGDPDLEAMPDDLVTALRDVIARIVTHWHEAPDGDIKSKSVGSKSVTYDDQADKLPRSVYRPLRPYDDRTPYSPGA